jgi:beta-lactamase regulating signal transducer with metallopeptidase domain
MTVIHGRIFDPAVLQELGWTLLHFLWQGTLLWIICKYTLRLLRFHAPQTRYVIACVVLVAVALASLLTYCTLAGRFDDPGPLVIGSATVATARWDMLARFLQRAFPIIILSCFLIIGILAVRPVIGWFWLRRLMRRNTIDGGAERERLQSLVDHSPSLGRRKVTVVCSTLVNGPAVVGWRQPILLAPADATKGLSSEYFNAIIAHELAHVSRHDYLVNLFQAFIDTLFGFHPAVRAISKTVRVERERCCDEAAAAIAGRETYTLALGALAIAPRRKPTPQVELAQHALGAPGSVLYRINCLVGVTPEMLRRRPGLAPLGSLLGGLLVCLIAGRLLASSVSLTPQRRLTDVKSLAAHVYGVLDIPSSDATFLPELAAAVSHSNAEGVITDPSVEQALVHKLVSGGRPDELESVMLTRITVRGSLRFLQQPGWPYGPAVQRVLVAQKLLRRAKEIHETDVSRAGDYARAALLLSAQENFTFGSAPLSYVLRDSEFATLAGLNHWQVAQLHRHIADHELITRICATLQVEVTDLVHRLRSSGIPLAQMNSMRSTTVHNVSLILSLAAKRPDLRWKAATLWCASDPEQLGNARDERRELLANAIDADEFLQRWLDESSTSYGTAVAAPSPIRHVKSSELHTNRKPR